MLRVIYAFITQGFRQQAAYKVEGWLGMLSGLIWFVLYAGIWTAILHGDPAALQRQMGYVIATQFLGELNFLPTWDISMQFRQGDVGLELIKPVALPVRVLGDYFGRSCFRVMRALPIYLIIWIAFRLPAPGLSQVLLFVVTALIGYVIIATLQLSLTLIALWTVQFDEADQLFGIANSLFSGSFIPLYYLPKWVGSFAKYLPFAGIFFVPSAILTGGLTGTAIGEAMLLQVVWALVGITILTSMWRAGSMKLTMQGG